MGVKEVYLQRLVFLPDGQGLAGPESALFEQLDRDQGAILEAAQARADQLGITFNASGATEPGTSLARERDDQPWSLCRRPWSLMYITAHRRALPCCIAPVSIRGHESLAFGDATPSPLREISN